MSLCKLPNWSVGDFRANQYHKNSVTIDAIHTVDLEELKYEIVSQSTVIVIDWSNQHQCQDNMKGIDNGNENNQRSFL